MNGGRGGWHMRPGVLNVMSVYEEGSLNRECRAGGPYIVTGIAVEPDGDEIGIWH